MAYFAVMPSADGNGVHSTPPGVLDSATPNEADPVPIGVLVLMIAPARPFAMPPEPTFGTVPFIVRV